MNYCRLLHISAKSPLLCVISEHRQKALVENSALSDKHCKVIKGAPQDGEPRPSHIPVKASITNSYVNTEQLEGKEKQYGGKLHQ